MKSPLLLRRLRNAPLVAACLVLLTPAAFAAGPPGEILNARNPRVQEVMTIQDQFMPVLLRIPGALATATGVNAAGELPVKVYTEWPAVAGVPPMLQGIPVDVEVSGRFVARLEPFENQ
jgi:hypothetical protein